MAATVQVHEMSSLIVGVDKTSSTVRFKSADEATVDTANRIQIPAAGEDYSYTKQLRFYFSTAPSVDIQNLEWYSDGANGFGTGIDVEYDKSASPTTYSANVDTDISGTGIFTITSGSPGTLGGSTATFVGTGYRGDLLRFQMIVQSTASPGTLSTETITFSYDES